MVVLAAGVVVDVTVVVTAGIVVVVAVVTGRVNVVVDHWLRFIFCQANIKCLIFGGGSALGVPPPEPPSSLTRGLL